MDANDLAPFLDRLDRAASDGEADFRAAAFSEALERAAGSGSQ